MNAIQQKWVVILGSISVLLSIPLITMQYTEEVNWSAADFMVMGSMLVITAFFIDLIQRKYRKGNKRYLIIGIVVLLFLLTWAELGVGIFGTPFAGN